MMTLRGKCTTAPIGARRMADSVDVAGVLVMRRYTVMLLHAVLLLSVVTVSTETRDCSGAIGVCIASLTFNPTRVDSTPPTIIIALEGVRNDSAPMRIVIGVNATADRQRCLPFGNPTVSVTLNKGIDVVVLPGSIPSMQHVFLDCRYELEITFGNSQSLLRETLDGGIPEVMSRVPLREVLNPVLQRLSPLYRLQWLDSTNLWWIKGYKVAIFREYSQFPQAIVGLSVTGPLIAGAAGHYQLEYTGDATAIGYTFLVYSEGVYPGRYGQGIELSRGPLGQSPDLPRSANASITATSLVLTTHGATPRFHLSWTAGLNMSVSDIRSVHLGVRAESTTGSWRYCLERGNWLVAEFPYQQKSAVTFPDDFPGYSNVVLQFGCRYKFQLRLNTTQGLYYTAIDEIATHPLLSNAIAIAVDISLLRFQVDTPIAVRNELGTLDVTANASWVLPDFPDVPLPFINTISAVAFECGTRRPGKVEVLLRPGVNDTSGHKYQAVLHAKNVADPWCIYGYAFLSVASDPIDKVSRGYFTPAKRITVRQMTVAPATTQVGSQTAATSADAATASSTIAMTASSSNNLTASTVVGTDVPMTTVPTGLAIISTDLSVTAPTSNTFPSQLPRNADEGQPLSPVVLGVAALCSVLLLMLSILVFVRWYKTRRIGFELPLDDEKDFSSVLQNSGTLNDFSLTKDMLIDSPLHVNLDAEEDFDLADHLARVTAQRKIEQLGEMPTDTQVDILAHNISMHGFNVDVGASLGAGEFGQVFKARLTDTEGNTTDVAIKTLHAKASNAELNLFHAEINIMKDMEPHRNVIRMLGCCEDGLVSSCLIVELMSHGNLQDFLREARANRMKPEDPYHNMTPDSDATVQMKVDVTADGCLGVKDTFTFAKQIAAGMGHLERLKIVHRDLAARNVLLGDEKLVKISDFGLAKDVYQNEVGQDQGKEDIPMPFKWMALESLQDNVFTSASDVWSFGVVLWETIMTGGHPYPTTDNCDLPAFLTRGDRMSQPPDCSNELYALMLECWDEIPENRPTFVDISHTLEELQGHLLHYVDLDA